MTRVRCTLSGTMTLDQDGADFSGSQTRQPNECVTAGGQQVAVLIGPVAVADGVIRGRSVEFVLLDGPWPSPAGRALRIGAPVALFQTRRVGGGSNVVAKVHQYDVAPDGRCLINVEAESTARPVMVLLNWTPD